jgi:hypothetical protein
MYTLPMSRSRSGEWIFNPSMRNPGGLGDAATSAVNIGGSTAGTVFTTAANAGVIGGIEAGSLAVPLIGAAIAGVTALVSYFVSRNALYHQQESVTTQIVNQAEVLLKQNLSAWQSSTKNQSEQTAAENNFQTVWSQVIAACNRPNYGDPGQRCIHDREEGACHYTVAGATPGNPPDDCGNWFVWYLDPIRNDPEVVPDPSPLTTIASSGAALFSGLPAWAPMAALAGVVALLAVNS